MGGVGAARDMMGSRGWADAMFVDAKTHWFCLLSSAAASPVRVPMLLTVRVMGIVVTTYWKTGVDLIGRIVRERCEMVLVFLKKSVFVCF